MNTLRPQHRNFQLILLIISIFVSGVFSANGFAADENMLQSPVAVVIDKPFYQAVESSHQLSDRFREQVQGLGLLPQALVTVWQKVAAGHSNIYPLFLLLQIACIVFAGWFVEFYLRRQLRPIYDSISSPSSGWVVYTLLYKLLGILLEGLFLFAFVVTSFILYVTLFPETGVIATIAANYLLAAYYIRCLLFLTTIFLSPARPLLRILPFTDQVSRFLFIWSGTICGAEIFLARSGVIMRKIGADQSALLAVTGLIIVSTTVMLAAMILQSRRQVAESLCSTTGQDTDSLACQVAGRWHLLAFALLLFVTVLWEIRVLDSGKIHFGKIIVALLTIPIFFALDVWGRRLLQMVLVQSGSLENEQGSIVGRIGIGRYMSQIQFGYRTLLVILLIFFFLGLFKVDVAIGRMFTAGVLTTLFIVILIYLAWQFFTGWVDQKIRAEMPDDEEADEGGKGGSRRGTLLLLLRKFVLILLVIIAFMSILSALGLNIAPLIAGAGILGLAISFGAQSLVTDIFAGIFFLIDDAFRVGDYIDTGTAKGLVEHISLRAVRLRHHRGMIQTVPFGKIGTVVNFSRDYIIMKLDFRVKYDTDVDKVRKIVKRIYKELLTDEELGPKLIGKLKSQGVREMEDSAMIMRIKFTTPPGEQFVMRKEILWRLQEAFRKNNIDFAHRNVTVYMPQEDGTAENPKNGEQSKINPKIQGAATAAILAEEEKIKPGRDAI